MFAQPTTQQCTHWQRFETESCRHKPGLILAPVVHSTVNTVRMALGGANLL
jgi:hypothetical protein